MGAAFGFCAEGSRPVFEIGLARRSERQQARRLHKPGAPKRRDYEEQARNREDFRFGSGIIHGQPFGPGARPDRSA